MACKNNLVLTSGVMYSEQNAFTTLQCKEVLELQISYLMLSVVKFNHVLNNKQRAMVFKSIVNFGMLQKTL